MLSFLLQSASSPSGSSTLVSQFRGWKGDLCPGRLPPWGCPPRPAPQITVARLGPHSQFPGSGARSLPSTCALTSLRGWQVKAWAPRGAERPRGARARAAFVPPSSLS